ncbi:MAG: hypothetical protein HN764_02480 [Gammaproteobacteria bacterium]|jgi:hypothetical protein|nr:hypothetical protein [Gammaproteobacteria bacterium]
MLKDVLDNSPFLIRDDLKSAINKACSEVGQVGAWLSGEQRLAIANEARHAWECKLCQRRKEALSPYAIDGDHDHLGALPEAWVEAVHRIVTDSGRITESWYDSMIAAGIIEDEFIELLSLSTMLTCIDTFTRGIGIESIALPTAADSTEPVRKRPGGVKTGPGWAPTVAPEDAGPELGNFYDIGHQFIRRSLTLVPDELNRFWNLMDPFYMANPGVNELEGIDRAISRAQIEFVATRVSKYLDCFY